MIFLIFRTIFDKIKAVTGDSYPASRAKSVVHRRFLRTRAKRIRRFVVLPLSALFCRFLLSLPSFSIDLSEILRRSARSATEKHAVLPSFAVLAVFSAFFVPDWKQPNVSCETFGCFLLFLSFSPTFCSLSFHPSFFTFSCLCVLPGVFRLLLHAFSGRFCLFSLLGWFLGVFFLILGWFLPLFLLFVFSFCIPFGIFVVFGLILRFCRGGSAGSSPSFCSFSLFSFMFLSCFSFFVALGWFSPEFFSSFFVFSYFYCVYCVPRFAVAFLCSFRVFFAFLHFSGGFWRVFSDFLVFFSFFPCFRCSRVIFDAFLRIFTAFRGFSFGFLCFLRLFLKNFVLFLL